MTKFIYMNQHIRERRPADPVIAVATGPRLVYCNEALIKDRRGNVVARVVFDPEGMADSPHDVRAWVETDLEVVPR